MNLFPIYYGKGNSISAIQFFFAPFSRFVFLNVVNRNCNASGFEKFSAFLQYGHQSVT